MVATDCLNRIVIGKMMSRILTTLIEYKLDTTQYWNLDHNNYNSKSQIG